MSEQHYSEKELKAMADQLLAEDAKKQAEEKKKGKQLDEKGIAALPAAQLINAHEKLKELFVKGADKRSGGIYSQKSAYYESPQTIFPVCGLRSFFFSGNFAVEYVEHAAVVFVPRLVLATVVDDDAVSPHPVGVELRTAQVGVVERQNPVAEVIAQRVEQADVLAADGGENVLIR